MASERPLAKEDIDKAANMSREEWRATLAPFFNPQSGVSRAFWREAERCRRVASHPGSSREEKVVAWQRLGVLFDKFLKLSNHRIIDGVLVGLTDQQCRAFDYLRDRDTADIRDFNRAVRIDKSDKPLPVSLSAIRKLISGLSTQLSDEGITWQWSVSKYAITTTHRPG